jgi:PAS domain S-box-containing protein
MTTNLEFLDNDATAIELQKAQATALFDSIGDGAIATDIYGRISNINQVALDLLGITREEAINSWFPKIIVAEDEHGKPLNLFDRPITKAFLTGKPITAKIFYKIKDGSVLPVAATVSPVMLGDKPIGAIEVFRDITLDYNVDKMKSEFISIASHQLRTPLSAIKTYSHLLLEGYVGELSAEQKELMDIIMTSIDRMNDLIDTLLDISKIERGKLGLDMKQSNLSDLLENIIQEMQPHADNKQIHLTKEITMRMKSVTDPVLVKEVFANLLSNAIKYTPAGGTVHIKLRPKDNTIIYSVKDNGYGIPTHVHDRIFTKFFRAPNVLQKETSGTGLGLYMVKSIADNLGGKIWFKSVEGKGSTFYFSLPIISAPKQKSR